MCKGEFELAFGPKDFSFRTGQSIMGEMGRWIFAAFLVAGIVLAAALTARRRSDPSTTERPKLPTVTVVQPERRDLERQITLTGDVLGIKQAGITAKVPGFIDKIYVNRGDFVKEGHLLAMLTYPEQEKAYFQAKAALELAQVTYGRDLKLFKAQVIARQELDNAREAYEAAKNSMQAQKTLYDYRIIRAPFSGYIIQRNYDPGPLIMPASDATPIFVLADLSTVRVFVYVPEVDVAPLKLGAKAVVTTDTYPGKPFEGEVTYIAQGLDPSTRTMQSEIHIANPRSELKPGMFARVTLVLERHPGAMVLPAGTVLREGQSSYVYRISDGRARRLPVETGWQQGNQVEIIRGLDDQAEVVATGWEQLSDNSAVRIVSSAPPGQPSAPLPAMNPHTAPAPSS